MTDNVMVRKKCATIAEWEICSTLWCRSKLRASVQESQERNPHRKGGALRSANSLERHCNGTQLITIQEFHGLSRDCPIDGNCKFAGAGKDLGGQTQVKMRRCRLSDFKSRFRPHSESFLLWQNEIRFAMLRFWKTGVKKSGTGKSIRR
jgi:hypothetical protein